MGARGVSLPRPVSRSRLRQLAVLVAIGVGQAAAAIGITLLVQRGFDVLVSGSAPVTAAAVVPLVGGLLLGVVTAAGLRGLERPAAERLGQDYVIDVREALFRHLTQVPHRRLGARNRGSLLMRFVGDLAALRSWVSLGLSRLVVGGLAVGLSAAALAVLNPALGIAVGGILLAGAAGTVAVTPWLLRRTREARRRQARLTGEVTERLTQVAVVQAAGQERRESRRVRRRSADVAAAMVARAAATGATRAVAEGTAVLATGAALVVGALEVDAGRATPGTVVAAIGITGLLSGHLRDLGRVAEYAAGAQVARAAARRFLEIPRLPDPPGLPPLEVTRGEMHLQAIGLDDALAGVTVHARGGETVAVVGPNGAGKSSLVALVSRMVDPDHGQVRVDGQDLRTRSLASVRRAVGVAGPDLPLLRGSVARNVRYRMPGCSEAELARITELCGLAEVVADLPGGWDGEVGDGGSRLSAGQRARLALARAVLGRPAVLVLDEADAHLDRHTVAVVDRILADHRGTALVVTHRRELVERADQVWFLQDGQLVESGPPHRLLAGTGPTARLFGPTDRPAHPIRRTPGDDTTGDAGLCVPDADADLLTQRPGRDCC